VNSIDYQFIEDHWKTSAIPELFRYASIPNKSPSFDSEWQKNGYMEEAIQRLCFWSSTQEIIGLKLEVLRLPGRTPLIFIDIDGKKDSTLLMYGHLDKQPEMDGWREGLGPWNPVIEQDRFYARGVADDGYALFAYLIAIKALQNQDIPHSRCLILIEACEESGSYDLPFYLMSLSERIGYPDLVICLDASCGNYNQLWCTTSLRGLVNGKLEVAVLKEGVHSGDASGLIPSSFRIARQLLSRIEDTESGRVTPDFLNPEIPSQIREDARQVICVLGDDVYKRFPILPGVMPSTNDLTELLLNGTSRPTLSVTGADGIPSIHQAGNVLRPYTTLILSLRLAPETDAKEAAKAIKYLLENKPPYGSRVTFTPVEMSTGWRCPPLSEKLRNTLNSSSLQHFGAPVAFMGDGGSIPFIEMLGTQYPDTQFLITGLLGPGSNAHGPNEFMHIPTVKKITCCVADVIAQL